MHVYAAVTIAAQIVTKFELTTREQHFVNVPYQIFLREPLLCLYDHINQSLMYNKHVNKTII